MIAEDNHRNQHNDVSEGHKMNSCCGCGGNNQHKNNDLQEAKYQCPMNCEGNRTYNQPGECPVCTLQLVKVGIDEPKIHVE